MKKSISVILTILMLLSTITLAASAATVVDSGSCGENLTWTLDSNGTLTISGSGDMYDFSRPYEVPWNDYREKICKIIFDGKITYISTGAFDNCLNLVDVNIPDSVLTIGTCAFANCIKLPEIIIPDSVTTIGYCAFAGCDSLTSVTIPASVSLIVERPFDSCMKLTEIYVDENNQNYSSDSFGVLFDKEKTSLISYPDANPRTSYTIPDSVTNIGFYSLWACKYLTALGIPASVTTIESNAISYCDNLTDIYYSGTQDEWNKIVIYDGGDDSNNSLKNATIHYNSCIENLSEDHIYNKIVTAPTCTERGYTTYTCSCGDSYIDDYTDIAEHIDADGDRLCDFCDLDITPEDEGNINECSHMCHKTGFSGFIWKIVQFFWKLFNINPVCECGAAHY